MSTKKNVAPEFKGATAKMYSLLKSGKSLTHAAVMAFKKKEGLSSAYAILFRLRRFGLKTKLFTITATGDHKSERTYKLVKGVQKGTSAHWPKALPVREAGGKASKPAKKKAVAKKSSSKSASVKVKHKVAAKTVSKPSAKKVVKKPVHKPEVEVEYDDNAVLD